MKIFLLIFVVCTIEAQHQIVLQYLGDSLSLEEANNRELCETKYCLRDAQYLFYGATQNKSVRPCDDFKEFALGTFIEYKSVSDRLKFEGFATDFLKIFAERVRKVLADPIKVNDTRISKGMKQLYAKCVSSKYINENGVREAREYARSIGLKFYPETNAKDFNLKNYIEQQLTESIPILFFTSISYNNNPNLRPSDLILKNDEKQFFETQLASYEGMLYDMNQIYRNSSYSEGFKKEFKEIANKQIDFYNRLKNVFSSEKGNSKMMTIDELNNLTSALNLNWLTILNNHLITKVDSSARIIVQRPQTIEKIAELLAKSDKDIIADYLVYDFLYKQSELFIVYRNDRYRSDVLAIKRPLERWYQCSTIFNGFMPPALDILYLQRYREKDSEEALRILANETIEFALKKIKSLNRWGEEVLDDISKRLQSIKLIFGFSEDSFGSGTLEELYGNLKFEQNLIKSIHEISYLHHKIEKEPRTSKLRQLIELISTDGFHRFSYRPPDDIMFIESGYLNYPFYHNQRPRYFNTATFANNIFKSLKKYLPRYLKKKFKIKDFNVFDDFLQLGYESYESWLESGGIELNLGANRLTNRQLYWIAAARINFWKYQSEVMLPPELSYLKEFHKFISSKPGFIEAFDCKTTKSLGSFVSK